MPNGSYMQQHSKQFSDKAAELFSQKDYANAAKYWNKAFELERRTAYLYNQAICYKKLNNFDAALSLINRVLTADPNDSNAKEQLYSIEFARGGNFYTQGKYDESARAYLAAYRGKPVSICLYNAAINYQKLGNNIAAISLLKQYLSTSPKDAVAVKQRISSLSNKNLNVNPNVNVNMGANMYTNPNANPNATASTIEDSMFKILSSQEEDISVSKAVDYLNNAIDIFEDAGMQSQADQIMGVLYKMAEDAVWEDEIPGGLADKKKPEDFDPKAIAKGIKVEMEHTNDKHVATEITMDHLTENPDYYNYLDDMEKKMDKQDARSPQNNSVNSDQMIKNLLENGTVFNSADYNSVDDLLDADMSDELESPTSSSMSFEEEVD